MTDTTSDQDIHIAILGGSVSSLYSWYEKKAREVGWLVLTAEDFWNRFRRRFPGSHWSWVDYDAGHDQYCIGRAVVVRLRREDVYLTCQIDEWGWFTSDGHESVLQAFIQEQETFSGEPLPEDDELPWE